MSHIYSLLGLKRKQLVINYPSKTGHSEMCSLLFFVYFFPHVYLFPISCKQQRVLSAFSILSEDPN